MTLRSLLASSVLLLCAACATVPSTEQSAGAGVHSTVDVPAEALNADVRQDTIQQTICIPGYAASVRPSTNYTSGIKAKLLRERGLPPSSATEFELDHRIPLALGGHPRSLANLQLQHWEGEDGAKKKDVLERRLQALVCSGRLSLRDAQRDIYRDWQGMARRSR